MLVIIPRPRRPRQLLSLTPPPGYYPAIYCLTKTYITVWVPAATEPSSELFRSS